ncbi:DNA invertase Pin-like site-specific DNA recombinase [Pseudomonas baetica]|uniref:DNA invertase Pin-like site-specific DNA recombinase n=1 Tax=Pseudomonas baetica TaxID=674054 RepID=A0ABX4Q7U7_9PSED|nr:recombinase family protein [Pseudomonas baetica]PKA72862.1 DNA invertase Pin-like site-specific DNA recombinase [Pseudomonas baetica]PTC19017.1 recombinase [Pseudomonas baetica]
MKRLPSKQAISYVRFSSERQRGGSSVERQQAMIRRWLDDHPDYTNTDLKFSDLGKSGFHGEHVKEGGGFGKLLLAVEAGAIKAGDVVLVEAIDRTGRLQALDMLTQVIAPILQAGVSIITLDDNTTYTKESVGGSQIFLLVAKIQAAHGYSRSLSERVSASYELRRKQAKEGGVTPKRITPVWLNSDGSIREDVAPWIKTAFELYVSGVGKATIAKRMRESGVARLAKSSGPGVEGWLRNKAVIGKWEVLVDTPDQHVIDDVYPAIIEPALFYKAQVHAEKMKTQRPTKTAKHFLVGLVKCGSCGKNYVMQNKDGKPHTMRCISRVAKSCDNSHIVPKPVMDAIYSYTSVTAALEAIKQQQMGVNDKEIVTREAELQELSRRVANLLQTAEAVGYMPELATKLKEANEAREAAENALVILRSTVVPPSGENWRIMGSLWEIEKEDSQRLAAMLRNVNYAITISPDGEITSTHTQTVYRYLGVDRALNKYKLMQNDKLTFVAKCSIADDLYFEPFRDLEGVSVWDETDYENLRQQHS